MYWQFSILNSPGIVKNTLLTNNTWSTYLHWSGNFWQNEINFISFFQLDKAENEEGVYQASGSANIILYVGLGMISIGLVITFVGLGEKGFRTLELKLIGPSLVGCGVFFALLRVLFCTVPSCCRACCKCCRKSEDTEELIYATVRLMCNLHKGCFITKYVD